MNKKKIIILVYFEGSEFDKRWWKSESGIEDWELGTDGGVK